MVKRGGEPQAEEMRFDAAMQEVADLARTQFGAFSRRQASNAGFTNSRLRRAVKNGELRHPLPNVFVMGFSPPAWKQSLMVATLADGVASHRAAAALHGLDGCPTGIVEVSLPREVHSQLPTAIRHRWSYSDEKDVVLIDGIRATCLERTLVQLGSVVSRDRVEQALDSALSHGASLRQIEVAVQRLMRPGPTGVGVLKEILEDPDRTEDLPESWFERVLTRRLIDEGLPHPVLQQEVATESGIRRLDLAYPEVKLGIEAHSRAFHFGQRNESRDEHRRLEISAMGWQVVFVTWKMTRDPETLARNIRQIYNARHTQLVSGT